MKTIYRIAEISFGHSQWDASYEFEYNDNTFQVQRYGSDYSIEAMRTLISNLRADVDAFAMVAFPSPICLGNQSFIHRHYFEIMNIPSSVPLCDGTGIREILNIQGISEALNNGQLKPEGGFFFPAALLNTEIEEFIRNYPGAKVHFGDLYSIFGIPLVLSPFPGLMSMAKVGLNIATIKNIKSSSSSWERPSQEMTKNLLASQIKSSRYIVADLTHLSYYEEINEIFKDKELIIWSHHAGIEKYLEKFNFKSIHNLFPKEFQLAEYMNYSVLEATIRLAHKFDASLSFEEWREFLQTSPKIMSSVRRYALPRKDSSQIKIAKTFHKVKNVIAPERAIDFAFVGHALSHRDYEKLPVIKNILQTMPKKWNDSFDKAISHAPPFVYGHIKNIVSQETGRKVNGIIYMLLSTPKVLKSMDPEATYAQIQKCCYDAEARGVKIIGLGAYTKVIGDSGVTINKNSPIPVTTGNSLSASATLWGLYDVVQKMKLLKTDPQDGKVIGTAMVIGATGSIGKVSAKLLNLVFKKLIIVAPRMDKLLELKLELNKMNPQCEIICCLDANEFASEVDALVTATSAYDQKIIDVMRLKPGCVVCDCSRPLDFSKEEAKKRPDIIIMESGELILPGSYEMTCDLGLPGKTVYACLAETSVLALEEKYESFTLGRDIDWLKVKEIYKLSRKHGVKLSSIQGHMGTLTDREIALTRELAISKRLSGS
ncbi:MAG: dehydrogenase [Bdellovibrionota bacterium]